MIQNTSLSRTSLDNSKVMARIAVALAAAFLVLLFLLHILEPEFDPSQRLISEYETGRFGWMMTLAFFCWGGSVLSTVAALWPSLRSVSGWIGRLWLLVIGLALFGAGIFITNASGDTTPSTANTLHGLCGAIVIFSSPIATTIVAGTLARHPEWITARRGLLLGTLLVWVGFLAFMGPNFFAYGANPFGPGLALGLPNRIMVVAYDLWLIIVVQRLVH